MNVFSKKALQSVVLSVALLSSSQLLAANGFVIRDIKVTGLQRVSAGTVLNYLPLHVGDTLNTTTTPKVVKALYDTGFFQYVSLGRQGNTLVIQVVERATIGSINVTGNKDIPSDKLKEVLKSMGMVKGRVFQRASLEQLEKQLKQEYNSRGKYNATITTKIGTLTQNRVSVNITISEGRVSRIKQIKIIGAHHFKDSELLDQFSLSTSSMYTYFTKKDQYSKIALDASLEALRSFYLDRGFVKFQIDSSQVLLSPDKKYVYINVKITEGPQYRFSGYSVVGKTVISKQETDALIQIQKGKVFSRKLVSDVINNLGKALGNKGYGFPAINAVPKVNEKNKTIFIEFDVNPGRHVYVRRVNFDGNIKTADYALRRIVKQNEGGLLSLANIKESERQLKILGYLKNINVKTTPVPGTNNQVDIDYHVEEAPSAEASLSFGYGTNGPELNAAFNQQNFMGTGRSVGLNFNTSYWGQNYSFNYYNPFYTTTGIGRGFNAYYQRVDPNNHLDVAAYTSDRFGGMVNYNFLLGDTSSAQLGFGFEQMYIKSVGNPPIAQIASFVAANGNKFNEIRLAGGWSRNTYDQMPYPTRGINQQLGVLLALPADSQSLTYYKVNYSVHAYQPLFKGFILSLLGNLGYGNTFNNQGLPFYENFYAGGIAQPGQVRGYDSYSLGPVDAFGNALGANFLASGSVGIVMPYPLSRQTIRTTAFVDFGNVYAEGVPLLQQGTTLSTKMRYSAGVSVDWRSPFGPLAFSLATPLNRQPGDRTEPFQFTVSSGF